MKDHVRVGKSVVEAAGPDIKTQTLQLRRLIFNALVPDMTGTRHGLIEHPSESHFPPGFGRDVLDHQHSVGSQVISSGLQKIEPRLRRHVMQEVECEDPLPLTGYRVISDVRFLKLDIRESHPFRAPSRGLDSLPRKIDTAKDTVR